MNTNTARIIGQVLENYWGTQSSSDGTFSLTYDLSGDQLTLKYKAVVHFASERSLQPQISEANRRAVTMVNEKLKELKSAYKSTAEESLKTEDLGGGDDIELLQPNGPRKVAYYRYNHKFKIQD
tara:strand:- start:11462 stop:11833 length:372 start_codon:yes stop_codon:yes gene_type:complete